MTKLKTNKNLTIVNLTIVSYFVLIYTLNFYKIDFVLIGVFRELLTIPFLLAQLVFLVIGIKYIRGNKSHFFTIFSLSLLAICTVMTFGNLF